jgi:hypothetical protein
MRHFTGMKVILCFPLFFAFGLLADEAQDRAVIQKVIAALNDPAHRSEMFTKDADSDVDFDRLVDLHSAHLCPDPILGGAIVGLNEPWTQMTTPHVVTSRIRFITGDVAIVDGSSTIEGAVTLSRSVPLLFVLKKEGPVWRISAVSAVRSEAMHTAVKARIP